MIDHANDDVPPARPPASERFRGPLPPVDDGGLTRPRIGIAGIAIESSTFSPHVSGLDAFTERSGEVLRDYYGFLGEHDELGAAAEWVPLVQYRSLPGGPVAADTYAHMRQEILDAVRQHGPFDAFYLDLHGAMSVVGMTDAEGDLATALRAELGDDPLVTTSMDLHGNVSHALLDAADLLTCYRMAPHEDVTATRHRAVHALLTRLRGPGGADPQARRPWKAWARVPVLLPGEKTSTRVDPAASLYADLERVEELPGVLDAAIWVGFAWADEPRCHAVVVVTGDDRERVGHEAEQLARQFWDAREEFAFVGPTASLADALDLAFAPDAPRPYVISDTGDNPTAGGAGDVSWTLAALAAHPVILAGEVEVAHASVFDAEAVATMAAAGVGARVQVRVGGRVDSQTAPPAELDGVVEAIVPGDEAGGTHAVLRVGGLRAIVTERRKPFHHHADFTRLGIDPDALDVLVVKIGYLEPELFALAAGWTMALTPGGVDQDLLRLGHHRLLPGTYPFEEGVEPDLTPVVRRRGEL